MFAKSIMENVIPPLKTSDTGLKALQMMEDFKVNHLAIVNNIDFLGLISETDILNLSTPDEPLGNHKLSSIRPYVNEYQHIYEVIKIIAEQKLTLIPVLDAQNRYLGNITLMAIIKSFAKISAIQNPGGIIVLELNVNDYSLSQIAQIVESNDAKIISLYISSEKDSMKFNLTLKINKTDLTAVLKTFQRYNYTVKASFHEDTFLEDMKHRYDLLMHYLKM